MDREKFLERLDKLIKEGKDLELNAPILGHVEPRYQRVEKWSKYHTWSLSCLNLLRTQFGNEHVFYKNFNKAFGERYEIKGYIVEYYKEKIAKELAVLRYIKEEFELGLVTDAKHLYEAELFSGILEQAFELAEKGYFVAAAVYCRLVIENFINDLCRVKELEVKEKEKTSQKLIKLRKKGIIDEPTRKMIQSKYDIGTLAVHGKDEFNKYTKEKIIDLLEETEKKILTIQ